MTIKIKVRFKSYSFLLSIFLDCDYSDIRGLWNFIKVDRINNLSL